VNVRFSALAVADLEEAHDYYLEVNPALGDRFLDDLDTAIERLAMSPAGAPPVEGFDAVRRARMRHFPYGIFYRHSPAENELLVVRVLHTRRNAADALPD